MIIDRKVAQEISDEIKKFSTSLESKYGVVLDKTSASFSDASVRVTINLKLKETKRDAGVQTPAEFQYDSLRDVYKLPARGTVIVDAYGEKWVPVEWIPKGRKFNILAVKQSDGKRYKFTIASIAGMKVV